MGPTWNYGPFSSTTWNRLASGADVIASELKKRSHPQDFVLLWAFYVPKSCI